LSLSTKGISSSPSPNTYHSSTCIDFGLDPTPHGRRAVTVTAHEHAVLPLHVSGLLVASSQAPILVDALLRHHRGRPGAQGIGAGVGHAENNEVVVDRARPLSTVPLPELLDLGCGGRNACFCWRRRFDAGKAYTV
jgi:hypothetical protein